MIPGTTNLSRQQALEQIQLIEAALVILRGKHHLEFSMRYFVDSDDEDESLGCPCDTHHECATTCCFLGYIAALNPVYGDRETYVTWREVSERCGVSNDSHTWCWLFGGAWSDDRKLNAIRLIYYLEDALLYRNFCRLDVHEEEGSAHRSKFQEYDELLEQIKYPKAKVKERLEEHLGVRRQIINQSEKQ